MSKIPFFLIMVPLLTLGSVGGHAECGTPQIAGDFALSSEWIYQGRDAYMTGKLEVSPGGRAVLRGGRLIYQDGDELVLRVGSAVGKIGVAPQCTAVLTLTFDERSTASEVANLEGNLVVSGDRALPVIVGTSLISIKQPGLNNYYARDLLGAVVLRGIRF